MLGLVAWIYFDVQGTLFAAEINFVLACRLWPRAIVQAPLTEADRASVALQALTYQRRPEQQILVTFNDSPVWTVTPSATPQIPEQVAPPASSQQRRQRGKLRELTTQQPS